EGGRYEARVGVAVLRTQRAGDRALAEPRAALAQRAGAEHLQAEVEAARALQVGLQRRHVGLAARELQVARADVFAVDADEFLQPPPDAVRALRQRQLLQRPALAAHAAVVDAAGARAAEVALEQHDAQAHAPQRERGRGADDAAADDGHLRGDLLFHAISSVAASTTVNGSGLIGAWPRKRPTSWIGWPVACARISAAAAPQMRPWQRPMPTRDSAFRRLSSTAPVSP